MEMKMEVWVEPGGGAGAEVVDVEGGGGKSVSQVMGPEDEEVEAVEGVGK